MRSGAFGSFRKRSESRICAPDTTLPGRVFTTGKSEWHGDLTMADDEVFCRAELAREAQLSTCIGVPLLADGAVAAVIVLMRQQPTPQDSRQLALLATVAAQLGVLVRRRQAEEALRDSEERFQNASRATSDVVYDWDITTNALWLSETIERNFGHPAFTGTVDLTWWSHLIHPDE